MANKASEPQPAWVDIGEGLVARMDAAEQEVIGLTVVGYDPACLRTCLEGLMSRHAQRLTFHRGESGSKFPET